MGWFSKKKKEKKVKTEQKKTKDLTACPICGKMTFDKVTTFGGYKQASGVSEIPIQEFVEKECAYAGDHTGLCETCGGIVHGWIFADHENVLSSMLIKDYNLMYLQLKERQFKAYKAGEDTLKIIPQVINERKELEKNSKLEFTAGYYILLMLIENKHITLHEEVTKAYAQLRTQRDLFKALSQSVGKTEGIQSPHMALKDMFKKILPQYF